MSGFYVIFILFFVLILFQWIYRFIKNENSPVIATKARLIDKKRDVHTNVGANGAMSTSETLYLIYELDTGSTVKLMVGGRIFRHAPEQEWGTLTFQGTRFLKFESPSGILER